MKKRWVYDLEVFKNFFSATFINPKTKEIKVFVIHKDRNDLKELLKFITTRVSTLIGYNNTRYDDLLLAFLLKDEFIKTISTDDLTLLLFSKSQVIINASNKNSLWFNNDTKSLMRYKLPYKQIDLMKVHAFDKKMISLKKVSVALKWPKVQDLPKKFNENVSKDEVDLILDYNLNDVLITLELFIRSLSKLQMRKDIGKKYALDLMNCSDSKITDVVMEYFYAKESGLHRDQFRKLRTPRASIKLSDCIFDNVKFNSREMNDLLEKMKKTTIQNTKGELSFKVFYGDVWYKIGTGGLHSIDGPGIFEPEDGYMIIDADVTLSMAS